MPGVDRDDTEGDGEAGRLVVLGAKHPIAATSFDEAITVPSQITYLSRVHAERAVDDWLGTLSTGGKVAKYLKGPDGVRLVFSEQTAAKLGTGELHIPVDRVTGLPRAEARDAAERIREPAKFAPAGSRIGAVTRGVVAAAHMISSIDTMAQLANISEQVTRLSEFMEADRRGLVRGVYQTLQRGFADPDPDRRRRILEHCADELDSLQGRFLETARATAAAISNPLDFGLFDALRKSRARAKRELCEQLGSVFGDLRLAEFCTTLNLEVQRELGNEAAAHVITESLRYAYTPILETLETKARYLDFQLANDVNRKAALLRTQVTTAPRGILYGKTR